MQKTSGFTLMELMITIAIIAIVGAIAIPNFMAWMPKFNIGSAARDVHAILQATRGQAIKDNANHTLQFTPATERYLVFLDDGEGTDDVAPADGIPDGRGNGVREATETIVSQGTLPAGVDMTNTTLPGDQVVFDTQGIASSAGTITITNDNGDQRFVILQLTGGSHIEE